MNDQQPFYGKANCTCEGGYTCMVHHPEKALSIEPLGEKDGLRSGQVFRDLIVLGPEEFRHGPSCECGNWEVELIPNSEVGFRCVGCKEPVGA